MTPLSSIDRLQKFADLLCQALPDLDRTSLSPRPLDAGPKFHVGRVLMKGAGANAVRALFVVSEASDFVPLALVAMEDNAVGVTLEGMSHHVGGNPAPPVGFLFSVEGENRLAGLGAAGAVLLDPATLDALSAFKEPAKLDGESFDVRLVVYLDATEMAIAKSGLPALMQRFREAGRGVFLSAKDFKSR
jgi:hypothetical protein